jgi:MFS transporter, DHA2 family, multidrug resistance protein
MIAVVVSIATFMEVLDVSIANVALRHIAGSVAASLDQATWILTSYLVANAVVLPLSGWLSGVIGRKRFYMLCVALFTASSLLCGMAWSLESLVFFRVLQGLGGGGLAPSEQAILADAFPPEKRGQAFAIYGVAVVVAPTIGPTLGGYITDHSTWHWIFFINVPMGLLSLFLVNMLVPSDAEAAQSGKKRGSLLRIDLVGFLLVALSLGCLEVVLDEGQRNDWFRSDFILAFSAISIASLLALIPWELTRKEPIVNLRLIGQRQFGACFLMMLVVGAIIFSTLQLLPQLVQEQFGYTATLAGLSLSPGGLVTMMMMPIAGFLTDKVQPKYLIAFGLALIALSMWHLTGLNGDITFEYAAWARIYTAAGLPFLFLPITTASYAGLRPQDTNQAAGLINVARNLGGSIGVAMVQTALQQRQQFHQSRLVEHIVTTESPFQDALRRATDVFIHGGATVADASRRAYALIGQTIAQQATLLAYIDTFWLLTLLCLVALPIAFLLRSIPLGKSAPAH